MHSPRAVGRQGAPSRVRQEAPKVEPLARPQPGEAPTLARLTLWMMPAAWMYCGDTGGSAAVSSQERLGGPTHSGGTPSPHLQPLEHLVDEELDSVLT